MADPAAFHHPGGLARDGGPHCLTFSRDEKTRHFNDDSPHIYG